MDEEAGEALPEAEKLCKKVCLMAACDTSCEGFSVPVCITYFRL